MAAEKINIEASDRHINQNFFQTKAPVKIKEEPEIQLLPKKIVNLVNFPVKVLEGPQLRK